MNNIHRESVLTAELHLMAEMVQRARLEATKLQADRDSLLDALGLLVAGIENSVSDSYIPLVKARAAIAKATGGGND